MLVINNKALKISNKWLNPIASPTPPTYYYVTTSGTNGTVLATPASGITGTEVTLSNTPDTGYEFDSYTITGATLKNTNQFDIGNSDVSVVGNFVASGPSFDEVTIGTQTWMASNLAIDDGQGDIFVQPNVVTNGASLGDQYFYNYASASRIANSISGWHLPSVSEYTTLLNYLYGGNVTTNNIDKPTLRKMMATNAGWNSDSSPNNDSGFGMEPVGCVTTDNIYYQCGDGVSLAEGGQVIHLLTSDTYSSTIGCYTLSNFVITQFNYSPMGYITNNPNINMGSVRLIKDT